MPHTHRFHDFQAEMNNIFSATMRPTKNTCIQQTKSLNGRQSENENEPIFHTWMCAVASEQLPSESSNPCD